MQEKLAFFGDFNLSQEEREEFEKLIFISKDSPLYKRNAITIRSFENAFHHYSEFFEENDNELMFHAKHFKHVFNKYIKGKKETLTDDFRYPKSLNIEDALKKFRFFPGHPVDGMVYGCTSLEPDLYIPLSSFHDYIFQSKMSSFVDMCSCLNAKTAKVSYVEENGREITSELEVESIPSQVEIVDGQTNSTISSKVLNGLRIDYTFPKPNHDLIEFRSPWLLEEPSWQTLNQVRFNRDVLTFQVELNHNNDFGVGANLIAMFKRKGAKIGGNYSEFKKRRLVYNVEFWPKGKK